MRDIRPHRARRPRPRRPVAAAVLGLALATSAGCKCERDRPFVPYTIDPVPSSPSAAPAATPSASAALRPMDGGTFARTTAQPAPPGTSTWTLGGLSIAAPPGRVFLLGLPLTTPGQPPAVAAFVGDGGSMAGEVVLYRESGGKVVGPTTLAKLPEWMPVGQECQHVTSLSQVGPNTVWLDVVAACKGADPKRPHRYVAAVSTTTTPAVRTELRTSDIPVGARLVLDADATDRDGDGTDDLLVQIALEGAPAPLPGGGRVAASMRFVGRDTGLSRETAEPGQSLRQQSSWIAAQAAKKGAAEEALASAVRLRSLFAMICAESGAPLLTFGDGAAIPCGDPAIAEDARYAEARALLTLGRLPAGFAQAARFRAARPKSKRATELDAALDAAAPVKKVKGKPLTAVPVASTVALSIAFDGAGKLLVLTEQGVVRVDPATGTEADAPDATKWSPRAELVGALKLEGGADACKTDLLRVNVRAEGGALRELVLPMLGSSPPVCTTPGIPLVLLDRNADGLTAGLLGEAIAIPADGERAQPGAWPTGPTGPGTARSPDGKWTALASDGRVLVKGPSGAESWKPTPFFTLNACTVANGGAAVACTLDRGAVLLTP